ncbi:Protein CBG21443 [Caenorhabditis briggsae]|uniref:Protein CBG21443 n=1 Tax=Caenorhabditis briggsae TaxID=6238 RepID=A8Y024_CAEBR|nr:Protein CBG21443 [Caenorhabditis briggsae]CAP38242.1 Protein CBG21443 [Caenorhabditis briggsae]
MAPPTPKFSKGEVCVCVSKGTPYKSKVINITQKKGVECYIVHFDGWNSRYDVAVKVGSEDGELFKGTVEEYQAKMGGSTPKAATPKAKATPKAAPRAKTPTVTAKPAAAVAAKTPKTPVAPTKTPAAASTSAKKTPVAKVSKSTPISKKKAAPSAKKVAPKKAEQSQESEESEAEDEEPMEVDESEEEPKEEPKPKFQAPEPPKKVHTSQKAAQEATKPVLLPRHQSLPTQAVTSEEIEIPIPQRLSKCLGEDYTIIGYGYEARLPVDTTIDKILEDYISQVCSPGYDEKSEKWNEIVVSSKENYSEAKLPEAVFVLAARSIQDYFNAHICSLFYASERVQYRKLLIAECKRLGITDTDDLHRLHELGFRPSAHYGFVHLLRVFPVLPQYMAQQEWNDHMINLLLAGFKKFIKYLEANVDQYYKRREDYVIPNHSEKEAEECMDWLARSVDQVEVKVEVKSE